MPPQRSDAERARFESIFERHQRAVLAYALRRARSTADAEDVAAETFLIAWRRLDDVPAEALPWLYGVARRVLANQRRGTDRRLRLLSRLRHDQHGDPAAASGEPRAISALNRLNADDQELLRLVAWEELSHAEIAAVFGISINAVAIRLHRARQRFAVAFESAPADELKDSAPSRTQGSSTGRPDRKWRHESTR